MLKRGRRIWEGALLVCVTVAAYLPALKGGFIWDDDTFLTQNRLIRAGDGLYRFWCTTQAPDYFPVTYTPLWFEWRLWGMHAAGYHAANLALHIAGALLLWAVLRRLRMPGAYVAAFIFAVHPVNVESVAWITQRKNLMALVFFLATTWSFLKTKIVPPSPGIRSGWYALSLLFFTLGMLSKGSVAMLPVILLGVIAWHRRLRLKDIALMLPFFFVSGILVVTDVWFQKHGSHEVFRSAGFLERLLGAGAVVWFYLMKALLPIHLLFIYPQWHIQADDPRWWAPLLAAAGLTVILWRYRRRFSRPALFAWGFFCVALVPVMGFTDVQFMQYSLVADHYEQIALIGVIGLVAAGFGKVETRIVAAGVIAILSVLTWRQCQTYRDAETLYRATLDGNPDCWLAQSNLGSILYRSGRIPEAVVHFDAALRLKPDLFEAQNDLGLALTATGRLQEATEHFDRAIQIHPDNAAVYYNAATALAGLGRLPDAIAYYERALHLSPGFAEAHQDLGAALTQQGRFPEAIRQYQEALRLRPDYFEAHANLGTVLAHLGRTAEARAQFEEALRLEPDDAATRANLARLPALP
jgi:protein O-mannosyl-transferase